MYANTAGDIGTSLTPYIMDRRDSKRQSGYTAGGKCRFEMRLEAIDEYCIVHLWSTGGMTVCNAIEKVIDQILYTHFETRWLPENLEDLAWVDHGDTLSIVDVPLESYEKEVFSRRIRLRDDCTIRWINTPFDIEELLTHSRKIYRVIAKEHMVEHAV